MGAMRLELSTAEELAVVTDGNQEAAPIQSSWIDAHPADQTPNGCKVAVRGRPQSDLVLWHGISPEAGGAGPLCGLALSVRTPR